MCSPEEALGGRRAVSAADVKVMHGRERGELAVAQAMTPMMMQRQLAVASFHTGAAALEQIGASAGDLFDLGARLGRQTLQRMIGSTQRVEQGGTRCLHALSGLGRGAACGDAFEVQGGDELPEDRRFQLRGSARASTLAVTVAKKNARVASHCTVRRSALARRSQARLGRSAAAASSFRRDQTAVKRAATRATGCAWPCSRS